MTDLIYQSSESSQPGRASNAQLGVHFILYRCPHSAKEGEKEKEREQSPLWKTDTSVCLYSVRHCCELISWKIKRWDSNKSFVNFYNPQTH